jgi:hypothetical protein
MPVDQPWSTGAHPQQQPTLYGSSSENSGIGPSCPSCPNPFSELDGDYLLSICKCGKGVS